jgi:hypothetical protein
MTFPSVCYIILINNISPRFWTAKIVQIININIIIFILMNEKRILFHFKNVVKLNSDVTFFW